MTAQELLSRHDVAHIRANNPGLMTLSGTNTWLLGRDPTYVVDPGPLLDDHVAAIVAEAEARGGAAAILATHAHADHVDALDAVCDALGGPPVVIGTGGPDAVGPLRAVPIPGHAPEHVAWVAGPVGFSGDAVLGEGSVFVAPGQGGLAGYLEGLRGLRALDLELIGPGHGPVVTDPRAKLDEYLDHRVDRERRLLAALDAGRRSVDELLDDAWSDAPAALRFPAMITLAAHLEKLDEEGRLPAGVERPTLPEGLHG